MIQTPLSAGVAEIDLTPTNLPVLCAELNPRPAEGLALPLQGRALVLANPQYQIALVTLDLLGLDKQHADAMVQAICQQAGFDPAAVVLVCSHTRGAPSTAPVAGCPAVDEAYLAQITPQIVALVQQAQAALQPASLGSGEATLPHLVWNHRLVTRNYRTISARWGIPENEVLYPEGPVDPAFQVLTVRDARGFPLCLLWNFAADLPYDVAPLVSAGLPAEVQQEVDRRMERHLPCLYLPGCGGNLSYHSQFPGGLASALASAILAVYRETPCDPEATLAASLETLILPLQDTSRFWNEADIEIKAPHLKAVFAKECEMLAQEAKPAVRSSLRVLRLGRAALAALPGIPFVEAALAIKEQSPFQRTLVVGNCHSYDGILATQQAFERGGYEVWTSRSCRVGRGGAEFLAEQAARLLDEINQSSEI